MTRELASSEDGGGQASQDVWWREDRAGQAPGPGLAGQTVHRPGLVGPQLGEMSRHQQEDMTALSAGQAQHSRPNIARLPSGAEDCGEVLSSPHLQPGVLTSQQTHSLAVPQHPPVTTGDLSLAHNQQLLLHWDVSILTPALSGTSKIIVVGILGINESVRASDNFSKERSHRSENSELVMINCVKWTSNKGGTWKYYSIDGTAHFQT